MECSYAGHTEKDSNGLRCRGSRSAVSRFPDSNLFEPFSARGGGVTEDVEVV